MITDSYTYLLGQLDAAIGMFNEYVEKIRQKTLELAQLEAAPAPVIAVPVPPISAGIPDVKENTHKRERKSLLPRQGTKLIEYIKKYGAPKEGFTVEWALRVTFPTLTNNAEALKRTRDNLNQLLATVAQGSDILLYNPTTDIYRVNPLSELIKTDNVYYPGSKKPGYTKGHEMRDKNVAALQKAGLL